MLRVVCLIIIQLFVPLWVRAAPTPNQTRTPTEQPCLTESNLTSSRQLRTLAETAQNSACLQTYQQNRCDEFKKSLAPEEQNKVISCDQRDSLAVGKVFLSCGAGAKDFVVDAVTGVVQLVSQLPDALKKTGELLQKCNEDSQFRASLFEPVAPLYSDEERRGLLNELPCEGLILTVKTQTQNGLSRIQEKKKLQENFLGRYPNREMPANIRLTPGEEAFMQMQSEAADAENARLNRAFTSIWQQVRSQLACYNTEAQVEATCAVVAGLAASAATGGGVTWAARSSNVNRVIRTTNRDLSPDERNAILEMHRKQIEGRPLRAIDSFERSDNFEVIEQSPSTIPDEFTYSRSKKITPGKSYTVLIVDERLIFGSDIRNPNGKIGGGGSHIILQNEVLGKFLANRTSYGGRGGAVRFNSDGSFDVSGYHLGGENQRAADSIANSIRRIVPDAEIRVTPGRLPPAR